VISFVAGMHDVGKSALRMISEQARSPGFVEWEIMKEHTKNGAYILIHIRIPWKRDRLYHHEWWDGLGTLMAGKGDDPPLRKDCRDCGCLRCFADGAKLQEVNQPC